MLKPHGDPFPSKVSSWFTATSVPLEWSHLRCYRFFVAPNCTCAVVRLPLADEPAVIRRLPAGVEYTHVKQIAFDLSGPLDVLPWFAGPENDDILSRLRRKSFRALDRGSASHAFQ